MTDLLHKPSNTKTPTTIHHHRHTEIPDKTNTVNNVGPYNLPTLAFELLLRDYRPTLILALSDPPQSNSPLDYQVLFANDSYKRIKELNEHDIYQAFANGAGNSCRCGQWIVHVTLIESPSGMVAVAVASSFENERDRFLGSGTGTPGLCCIPPEPLGDCKSNLQKEQEKETPAECHEDSYFAMENEDVANVWSKIQTRSRTARSLNNRASEVTLVDSDDEYEIPSEDRELLNKIASEDNIVSHMEEFFADEQASDADSEGGIIGTGELFARKCRDVRDFAQYDYGEPVTRRVSGEQRPHRRITDWRILPNSPEEIEKEPIHFRYLRNVDWSKTAFGPMYTWSPTLRSLALGIMENSVPVALYWGPNYDCMYNDEYRKICHQKDPPLLGQGFSTHWPELWSFFKPLLDASYYESKNIRREAALLIFRSGDSPGSSQERYFDFSLLPIVEDSGIAEGVLEITVEQTQNVITGRRMDTLNRLSNSLKNIQDFDGEFWTRVVEAFDENKLDSPMLILYRTTSSFDDNVQHLEQAIGATPGGVFAPHLCFDTGVRAGTDLFHAEMRIAKQQNKVVIKEFPPDLRNSTELVSRGFPEPPTGAAIIPIQVTASCTRGFLILGLNPKRPLDGSYKFWFECIRKEVAAAATGLWARQQEMAQVVEQERQKGMKQLTEKLRNELSRSAEALRHSEVLFRQVAEILPVALLLMDLRGKVFYTNPTACYMYRVKDHDEMNAQWAKYTYHEDRQAVLKYVDIALKTKSSICMHHRIGNDNRERGWEYWVAASICVQEDEKTGEVLRFIITMVDITSHKQNEEYQRQLSTQAVERRRQQENFIDIFSHELLNPFSATLQCADSILASLTKFQNIAKPLNIDELIDSAQTILVCVQHQKRIIDDVLTLSKLESMALTVVPISVRLHESVAQMMKIFQSELQAKRIRSTLVIENSYKMLDIDWVMADPSRFSQVLVNLLTNAIKFSSPMSTERREITVRLGASKERPLGHGDVQYRTFTTSSAEADTPERSQCVGADWGEGEALYIQATVEDTGIGISKKWQAKLFQRFEQVPKTHVTYGGSGLGLFICRRLCRIQGGEIGFWSEEGKGSQFAFFIKVYRSETPAAEEGQQTMELASLRNNSGYKDTPTVLSLNDDVPGKSQTPVKPTAYRVLIVEDNLINQEVLRRQLKNEGCVTHVANDGQQALDFVRTSSFSSTFSSGKPGEKHGEHLDIILMDMEMPIMDGCTATRKIRELEQSGELIKHVPIVGISANARPEQVAMMTEAGMDDAIPKPFRIPHLLERFAVVMKKLSVEMTPIVSRRGSGEIERVASRDGKESSTPASGTMSTSSSASNLAAAARDRSSITNKRREATEASKRDGKRHQTESKDVIQKSNSNSPKPGVKKDRLQAPKIPKALEPSAPPTPGQLQFKLEQLFDAENSRDSDNSGSPARAGAVTSPPTGRTATRSRAKSRSVSRAGSRRNSDVSPRTTTPRVSEVEEGG